MIEAKTLAQARGEVARAALRMANQATVLQRLLVKAQLSGSYTVTLSTEAIETIQRSLNDGYDWLRDYRNAIAKLERNASDTLEEG